MIGVVVLLALGFLSLPLWRGIQDDNQLARKERQGLQAFVHQEEALSSLVALRSDLGRARAHELTAEIDKGLGRLAALSPPGEHLATVKTRWQNAKAALDQATAQQHFSLVTGVINAMLNLTRHSAQHFRLNVDPELDVTFDVLTTRMPLLLDTLGKQQDALMTNSEEMASYALGAQVILSESVTGLTAGLKQLSTHQPDADRLKQMSNDLLDGISQQQEAADKALGNPDALDELQRLSGLNQVRISHLLKAATRFADLHLQNRIDQLHKTEMAIACWLVGNLAVIAYLFSGIYFSTIRSLRSLSEGTDQFCAGRLDARIEIDTKDELVLVARNFNTLAVEFTRLLEVIREQNDSRERELEIQVQARTAELAEKNEQLRAAGERVQEELVLASNVQLAILPQEFPDEETWSVHARMYPARELGGDFYDWLELPDGRYGVVVADVSGKGVGAAFFMAVSRTLLLDVAMKGGSPGQVLMEANNLLFSRNSMDLFVTLFYGIFDPRDGTFIFANAGHPPPMLRRVGGTVEALPSHQDLALAIFPDMEYQDLKVSISPGESLLLYTDGVTEAMSPTHEEFGVDRLGQWLQNAATDSAEEMIGALIREVDQFVDGAEPSDDLTCLILTRKPGDTLMDGTPIKQTNKRVLLEYKLHPTRLEEIAKMAAAVTEALPKDRDDLAFQANLCLDELITNTISYGLKGDENGNIHLLMSISDEWLEIILKDDAPQFDPFLDVPQPDLDLDIDERPIGGLGVHLVKKMMDDARAYYNGSGNVIVLLKTLRK